MGPTKFLPGATRLSNTLGNTSIKHQPPRENQPPTDTSVRVNTGSNLQVALPVSEVLTRHSDVDPGVRQRSKFFLQTNAACTRVLGGKPDSSGRTPEKPIGEKRSRLARSPVSSSGSSPDDRKPNKQMRPNPRLQHVKRTNKDLNELNKLNESVEKLALNAEPNSPQISGSNASPDNKPPVRRALNMTPK